MEDVARIIFVACRYFDPFTPARSQLYALITFQRTRDLIQFIPTTAHAETAFKRQALLASA